MSLFHYTDAAAVKSILEKNELWLTDIRFMNDAEELQHGLKLVMRYFDDLNHKSYEDINAVRTVDIVRDNVDQHLRSIDPPLNLYSCSFSTAQGLLSQWRAYGLFAIEFDESILADAYPVFACSYNDDESYREIKSVAASTLNAFFSSLRNGTLPSAESNSAYDMMLTTAARVKHPAFAEEQEKRILINSNDIECGHRCKGNLFVPYAVATIPAESIIAVHVGPQPNQMLVASSLLSFLNAIPSRDKVKVIVDDTPFRAP